MMKLIQFAPVVECRALASVEDKCQFIQQTEDCSNAQGLINYLSLLYCNTDGSLFTGGILLLAAWIFFLFMGLATAANTFFCPVLKVLSEKMRMSDNVAGVTLLALGNGAPDIFSSLAGIRQGRAELAFGELFGAGIFCTTMIAGSISCVRPFHVMERPFLRDCVFYLSAVYFVFWVFFHQHVSLGHAIGFIAFYGAYVFVVVIGRLINSRLRAITANLVTNAESQSSASNSPIEESSAEDPLTDGPSTSSPSVDVEPSDEIQSPFGDAIESSEMIESSSVTSEAPLILPDVVSSQPSLWESLKEEGKDLKENLRPFSLEEWTSSRWFVKILYITEAPFHVLLRSTIPSVNKELPRMGWCRPLLCLQLSVTPCWIVWALGYGNVVIGKFLPLPLMVFLIGTSCAFLLAIFTHRKLEPPFYWLFSLPAFFVVVVWIDLIASEIMAVLFTFGVVFQLSDAILGLTILAWGNSVGDFAADVSMARSGSPRMGFSACFGAPLLNTLLGLGISFAIVCSQLGQSVPVKFTNLSLLMSIFLVTSLVTVFIWLPLNRFKANKWLGIMQFLVYLTFLTVAILQEADVLLPDP